MYPADEVHHDFPLAYLPAVQLRDQLLLVPGCHQLLPDQVARKFVSDGLQLPPEVVLLDLEGRVEGRKEGVAEEGGLEVVEAGRVGHVVEESWHICKVILTECWPIIENCRT